MAINANEEINEIALFCTHCLSEHKIKAYSIDLLKLKLFHCFSEQINNIVNALIILLTRFNIKFRSLLLKNFHYNFSKTSIRTIELYSHIIFLILLPKYSICSCP